eukprot:13689765-Alexandrium_andersonii.AAC.1
MLKPGWASNRMPKTRPQGDPQRSPNRPSSALPEPTADRQQEAGAARCAQEENPARKKNKEAYWP